MSYKTILVHVAADPRCAARLDLAIDLAKAFDASLVALHAVTLFTPPGYIAVQMGPEAVAAQHKIAEELLAKTEEALRRRACTRDFANLHWLGTVDDPLDAMCAQAKYADLVVIGQSDPADGSGVPPDFPQRLILAGGRPVLIVPRAGRFETLGEKILVAWNASREATRAVTDALPLLRRAGNVHVMAVGAGYAEHQSVPGTELARYLARHDVKVAVDHNPGGEIDVGNELLSRAADMAADLIVMGGYGHSRLREWVLGGATRTMLETMTVPVLMSH